MTVRSTLSALLAASMMTAAAPANAASQRPDIVVIVLDDVGYSDIGAYGGEIRTPVMDSLAEGGLRYNRFDTRAVCSATRAALLTGRNNQSLGMENLPSDAKTRPPGPITPASGEMPRNAQTLAEALAARGYATFAIGKWHLSPKYDAPPEGAGASWPTSRGFQKYYGFISGWTDQYKPQLISGTAAAPVPERPGYHLTEDLVDRAIAELDARPAGQPAFLYLALGAAHSPIQVPKRYIDAYAGTYERGWDALRDERFARQKAIGLIPAGTALPAREAGDPAWDSLTAVQKRVYARFMAAYAGFMTHTDEQIGRLVAHLRQTGRFDNTLILVMSDNGAASESATGGFRRPYADVTTLAEMDARLDELGGPTTQPQYQRPWAMLGSTPFRRYKLWPYSGGIRAPLIVSWPAGLRGAGAIRSQPVDVVDIAPTLLEAAGARFAGSVSGERQLPVAGRSILPTFRSARAPTRDVQFFGHAGNRAIRAGGWEAVGMAPCEGDGPMRWKLFRTDTDFAQAKDLAPSRPDVVARLATRWQSELDRWVGMPLPKPDPVKCRFWYRFNDDAAEAGR